MILVLALFWLIVAIMTAVVLRKHSAFFQRLNDLHWQLLVQVDIVAAFVIFWPLYLVGLLAPRPGPWVTISTHCGACALEDRSWAIKAAAVIDALFFLLTSEKDHCMKSYLRWSNPLGGA